MATTPLEIVQRAQWILNDEAGIHYEEPDLFEFFNDGQREVALQVPEASVVEATLSTEGDEPGLVVGVSQRIPASCHFLIDISHNTTGEPIERADRIWLDTHIPGWRKAEASEIIKCFCYDPRTGRNRFLTYPAVAPGASIECILSAMPDDSSYATNTLQVDKIYANALLDYIMFRALLRFVGNPTNMSRAQGHLQSFFLSCGKSANSVLLLNNPELNLQQGG